MNMGYSHHKETVHGGDLGSLLDTCGHYFAHRVGGSKRGRGKVIELIANKPGITQKELAEALGIQPASVSELLMKLERKGLVQREKDTNDRRAVRVNLTAEGMAETEKTDEQTDPFQALTEEEKDTLKNLLEKLIMDWESRYPHERGRHEGKQDGGHHGRRGNRSGDKEAHHGHDHHQHNAEEKAGD